MNEKPTRHRPTRYGEYKTRVNISLTQTGIDGLEAVAKNFRMSRSELIEKIGRGDLIVSPDRDKLGEPLAS